MDQVRAIRDFTANQATNYSYGPNREPFKRVDYTDATATSEKKRTLHLGQAEIVRQNGVWEIKRSIAGVAIVTLRSDGKGSKEYLFTDHLGSTDVITDRFGNVGRINNAYFPNSSYPAYRDVGQRQSFDAFGARRAGADWQHLSFAQKATFDSTHTTMGYTGHQMADGVGLIHMRGRMYDPVLGRFIQADPFIQDPTNSQSLNRYSYVLNHPLSATDPSGYFSLDVGTLKNIGDWLQRVVRGYERASRIASTIYRTAAQAQRNDWNLRQALPSAFGNWFSTRPLAFDQFNPINCFSVVGGCTDLPSGAMLKDGCEYSAHEGCAPTLEEVKVVAFTKEELELLNSIDRARLAWADRQAYETLNQIAELTISPYAWGMSYYRAYQDPTLWNVSMAGISTLGAGATGYGVWASNIRKGAQIAGRAEFIATGFPIPLRYVNIVDADAAALAAKLGNNAHASVEIIGFSNKEFDAINDLFIAETKAGSTVKGSKFRRQARRVFEASEKYGRIPYFHFGPGDLDPDVLRVIERYAEEFKTVPVIDRTPL